MMPRLSQIQQIRAGVLLTLILSIFAASGCAKNGFAEKSFPESTSGPQAPRPTPPTPAGPLENGPTNEPTTEPNESEGPGRENGQPEDEAPNKPLPPPPPFRPRDPAPNAPADYQPVPLSWESPNKPERKLWSAFVLERLTKNFETLDQAVDIERFCRRYERLSKPERINVWGLLVAQMSLHESSWKPTTRMQETTMGVDKITGARIYSEGLLQLSYQDISWMKSCRFDWDKDRFLGPRDPKKTILDPYRNLECGIDILVRQISRYKRVVMTNNVYWAILREGGKYSKIAPMSMSIGLDMKACN